MIKHGQGFYGDILLVGVEIKFRHEKRNLKGIERSPMYRGIKLWNTIPQALQRATTKVKFKTGLRQHLTMPTR